MRHAHFFRAAALIAVAISPVVALAQFAQFQAPTPDELKMTEDPKAPGAAAVFLNVEENWNDNLGSRNFYARIKVLADKGKELATIEVPYGGEYKVIGIKGRTIHPDGTIIPLEVKPEDLIEAKQGDYKMARKVFTLPNVEVGSILEYRYDIVYPEYSVSSPLWEIQRPYFIHKARYSFEPFKAFLIGALNTTSREVTNSKGESLNTIQWWDNLPAGQKVVRDGIGRYSVDVTDMPARPDEDWMPPINSIVYRAFFYYTASTDSKHFWDDQAKNFSKDVNRFADVSGPIKSAVAGIVAPGDADLVKAKKLYDAVQALDNTDYSRAKTETEKRELKIKDSRRAEDTWSQKSGNSNDIAMLYLAMLRAAGLNAFAIKVVDRSQAVFDVSYMDEDQFDDVLVILGIDGKQTMLDPGEKMCPFQTVSWRHSVAGGVIQTAAGGAPGYAQTPDESYVDNMVVRIGDITIDEHGSISGDVMYNMTGQAALEWRQKALRNNDTELKKQFDHALESDLPEGVEGHIDHFIGIDHPDQQLSAVIKVSGAMGAATAKRILLPGFFFASRAQEPFVNEEKRQVPVDMHYPGRLSDQVTYHLPAGLTVEGAPADSNVSWAGHAIYIAKIKSQPGSITVARSLANAFTMTKPEEYQDLRGFYQKVASGDQQQVVLTVAQGDKAQ